MKSVFLAFMIFSTFTIFGQRANEIIDYEILDSKLSTNELTIQVIILNGFYVVFEDSLINNITVETDSKNNEINIVSVDENGEIFYNEFFEKKELRYKEKITMNLKLEGNNLKKKSFKICFNGTLHNEETNLCLCFCECLELSFDNNGETISKRIKAKEKP